MKDKINSLVTGLIKFLRNQKPTVIITLIVLGNLFGFLPINAFFKLIFLALLIYLGFVLVINDLDHSMELELEHENSVANELDQSILELATSIEEVTSGGLGGHIPISDNEKLAKIANSFNYLLEKISAFIKEVDGMSEDSSATSRQLEDISAKTSKVMHELSATLEELTSTTMHLNDSVEEIAKGAKEIDDLSKSGMDKLASLETKMGGIAEESLKTNTSIEALNQAAGQMQGIISVIGGIAKQTNLLALNAAIEAARAGDAGRGFAVVADEVGKLAGNTQSSLDDISSLINKVSQETSKTVTIIEKNNKEIKAGTEILHDTVSMFQIITNNISTIVEEIDLSADAAANIARGSQEIAEAAGVQTAAIGDISLLSKSLSEMSTDIKNTLANTQVGSSSLELDLEAFDAEAKSITPESLTDLRTELGVDDRYLIAMIARLEGNKGHSFFLKGLKETIGKHPEVRCIIAGDGSLEFEIKQQIKELEIEENVKLIGYRDDINKLLFASNLLVATSRKEGIPPRILEEAMAASKPIVSTEVEGAKVLLENTKNALLVPYDHVEKLASAMNKMIEKPFVAENFGKEARAKLEKLYYS